MSTSSSEQRRKPVVVFLCVHNSCRSQMAEGIARRVFGDAVTALSAGSERGRCVNAHAVTVMKEIGIDITSHSSKHMEDIKQDVIDLAVTMCSSDGAQCPSFQRQQVLTRVHHEFNDPSAMNPSGDDGLQEYRRVRDEIAQYVRTLYPELQRVAHATKSSAAKQEGKISFFEKYLSLWVLICIVTGSLIGYYVPGANAALKQAEIYKVSIPISVLLWVMIFPMLLQIDFAAVMRAVKNPGPIVLTTGVNFGIQPFTMYIVCLVFFRYIYSAIISRELADEYLAGCILLGGAPCTAMVFVWSVLVGGDPGYTLMQVAVNDMLMLALYLPTMMLLLNASSIPIPYETIAISVGFFIVAPLLMSIGVRQYVYRHGGQDQLNRMIELFKPVTTVGLLATLVLIFIYQGHTIGSKPLHIVLIAIPLTIQTLLIFSLTYWMGYMVCLNPEILGPASMISTSNFFELAVAIAVAVYGADSGASLATVVGILVEVPTMLFLVWLCKKMAPSVLQRNAECDVKCKGLRDFAQCHSCKPASPKEAYVEVVVLEDAGKRVGAEEA